MAYIGEKNQGEFNNKIVTERTPIIELNGVMPLSELRDDIQTSGGGSVTDNGSVYQLGHDSAGDFAKLTSSERGRYIPGNSAEVGVGMRLDTTPSNGDMEAIWGYFHMGVDESDQPTTNIQDGFFFGMDTSGLFVQVVKNGSTIHGKTYKNNWNIRPNIDIDLTHGHVFQVHYTYYGYGLITFQMIESEPGKEQRLIDLHSVRITGETSLGNSNLKVGGLLKSTNTSDTLRMEMAGRQFSTVGKFEPNVRITTESREGQTIGTESYTPIMSFRRKPDERQTPLELYGFEILSDNDIITDIRIDGGLGGGASFTDISNQLSGETSVEVDTSATSIDTSQGVKLIENLVSGGSGGNNTDLSQLDNLPLSLPDRSVVTLSARAISAEATVSSVFKIREEF